MPPTVFQATPGLESCCPGFGAGGCSGTDPRSEEAAAAEVVVAWFECLPAFSLSFADAGATTKATVARVAAAMVSIEAWSLVFITILPGMSQAAVQRIIQQTVCLETGCLQCRIAWIGADCVALC